MMNSNGTDPDRPRMSQYECPNCSCTGIAMRDRMWCPGCGMEWMFLPALPGVMFDPIPYTYLDNRPLYRASRGRGELPCQYIVSSWNGVSGEDVCIDLDGQWWRAKRTEQFPYFPPKWEKFKQGADGWVL